MDEEGICAPTSFLSIMEKYFRGIASRCKSSGLTLGVIPQKNLLALKIFIPDHHRCGINTETLKSSGFTTTLMIEYTMKFQQDDNKITLDMPEKFATGKFIEFETAITEYLKSIQGSVK